MKYPSLSPRAGGRAAGCRTRSSGVQLQVRILEVEAVVEHDPIELSPLDLGRNVADPVRMVPCSRLTHASIVARPTRRIGRDETRQP
jgi:hypothetical protein